MGEQPVFKRISLVYSILFVVWLKNLHNYTFSSAIALLVDF